MTLLDSWQRSSHSADGLTFDTYRKGSGPGVVVIPEIPGPTPKVIGFCEEVVAAGFTVVMPVLFGTPETPSTAGSALKSIANVCVRREFTKLATGVTSPVAGWLRSLARELHEELGGPGVGALGMCFTGGFALAMMVDAPVVAPVVSQPSVPFAVGKKRAADVNLSPEDLACVKKSDLPVMGLRYKGDPMVGTRFDTLQELLGDRFIRVEFDGKQHSVLTEHRQQEGVDRVLEFFQQQLSR